MFIVADFFKYLPTLQYILAEKYEVVLEVKTLKMVEHFN